MVIEKIKKYLTSQVSIAPLVIFRIAFGILMSASIIRFIYMGWVEKMYILPKVYFPFFGFEWIKPLPALGMYIVFGLLLITALFILIGFLYRISTISFFLLFTYVELIDKTNYLNHYYFISLISLILIFLPAGKAFSLDNKVFKRNDIKSTYRYFIFLPQLQMFTLYFFAGVAKINYDWLIEAQPLKIWLPAYSHFPFIGSLLEKTWIAYFFCWFGCIYDLCIGFLLFNKRTVYFAYFLVIVFHMATSLLFNIGMFPYIMMTITIIFFKEKFHIAILNFLEKITNYSTTNRIEKNNSLHPIIKYAFIVFFVVQFLMPFRYALYDGKLFWTEQGYRFSWRVMLMEKAGTAFFFVEDKKSGKRIEIDNKDYLTYMQEKMVSTQPDMMIDYAKFLKEEYNKKGLSDIQVKVQSYVTLNGSGTREFIDPTVDLSLETNNIFKNKNWIRSY
ncbi:MAG: HTTM domain-containing protein [Sphingobacteriaceae bacterium]|nr:HTTM domain-containing protein [Sphingobacteriaceae bacterium]